MRDCFDTTLHPIHGPQPTYDVTPYSLNPKMSWAEANALSNSPLQLKYSSIRLYPTPSYRVGSIKDLFPGCWPPPSLKELREFDRRSHESKSSSSEAKLVFNGFLDGNDSFKKLMKKPFNPEEHSWLKKEREEREMREERQERERCAAKQREYDWKVEQCRREEEERARRKAETKRLLHEIDVHSKQVFDRLDEWSRKRQESKQRALARGMSADAWEKQDAEDAFRQRTDDAVVEFDSLMKVTSTTDLGESFTCR